MNFEEEFSWICRDLEGVEQAEESDDMKLNIYEKRFKRLLDLVPYFASDNRLKSTGRAILVSVGHTGKHYWTNHETRELARDVLIAISKIYNQECCERLLVEEVGLLDSIMNDLKALLTKESWKSCPVYKHAFVWCVRSLKHPHMGEWLSSVIPPVLWMCDDHQDYNRVLSLSCMSHIIDQTDPTELRWHGWAELLYQAMKPLLHVSSCETIYSLHPCLIKLLPVINYLPNTAPIPAKPDKTDEVLSLLLTSLTRESKLTLKRAYASQIQAYIILLSIFSVRHMKTLLPLLLTELLSDPYDSTMDVLYLDTLSTLICYTWPRIPAHKISILKALSTLVTTHYPDPDPAGHHHHHHTSGDDEVALVSSIVKCMSALLKACPELKEEYEHLEKCCSHQKMMCLLQQTLQKL